MVLTCAACHRMITTERRCRMAAYPAGGRVITAAASAQAEQQCSFADRMEEEQGSAWIQAIGSSEEPAWLVQLFEDFINTDDACPVDEHDHNVDKNCYGPLEVQSRGSDGASTKRLPPVPRKRRLDELNRLRDTARDLEAKLAMMQTRQAEGLSSTPPKRSRVGRLWKAAANRQQEYLEQSRRKNQELKRQIQQQLAIARRLEELIYRGQRALRLPAAPESIPNTPMTVMTRELKRHELATKAMNMIRGIGDVLCDRLFANFPRDFRRVYSCRNTTLSFGSVITSSRAGHVLPMPFSTIKQAIWIPPPKKEFPVANGAISIEDVQHNANLHFISYCIRLPTDDVHNMVRGMALRCHIEDAERKAVVMVVSPYEPVPASFETRISAIVQPHSSDVGTSTSELLVKIESTATGPMSAEEVDGLKSFLMPGHAFFHDQMQRSVDELILQQAIRR